MFSATDAAFEGFRLAGRRPLLMLLWAVLFTVGLFALLAVMLLIVMPPEIWQALIDGKSDLPTQPDFNPLRFAVVFPLFFAAILLLSAMINTAIFRAILRPRPRGFGHVAIGGDEGRQILLMLLIFLVTIPVVLGFLAVAVIVPRLTPQPYTALAGVFAVITAVALVVWVSTRLSLAAVQTFAERRVTLFGSWKLTRGRFWPLLGMWLLAFVFTIIVSLVATAISYVPLLVAGAPMLAITGETLQDLRDMPARTAVIVAIALQALIQVVAGVLQTVIGIAPGAAAYAQLKAPAA